MVKHLIMLVMLCFGVYFGWYYATRSTKRVVKKFTGKHVWAVLVIIVAIYLLLAGAFYFRSASIF